MKNDPWHKAAFSIEKQGVSLKLAVPHDVFSTANIDEGTLLLLDHLPRSNPASVLDMGCGYGALGLPIASAYPNATVEMVDRDLLPVAWAKKNAAANRLLNAVAHGSLGYRDLSPKTSYDWILCNVPARIGRPFITHLLGEGCMRLKADGELRIVVIRDLAPVIEEIAREKEWPVQEEARGPKHVIFSLKPTGVSRHQEPENLYTRDIVEVGGLKLDRPYDLRGDDPKYLSVGLPILLDALPRKTPRRVLCFRGSYGALPLIARARWPEAEIVTVDRDLLMTTFTLQNARKLGLDGPKLDVREAAHLPDAIRTSELFDLTLNEVSPAAGQQVALAEKNALQACLAKDGQTLLLALDKLNRDWLKLTPVISRQSYSILRLTGT